MRFLLIVGSVLGLGLAQSGFRAADTVRSTLPGTGIRTVGCITRNGDIKVQAHGDTVILVETVRGAGAETEAQAQELLGRIDASVERDEDEGVLGVEARMPENGDVGVSFRFWVPEAMNLELETELGSIRVDSMSGSIKAAVDLGGIGLRHTTGRAELRCGLGPVCLQDHSGPAGVEVETGPVSCVVRGPGAADTVRLVSGAGPIEVFWPQDVGCRLELRCGLGSVSVEDLDVDYEVRVDTLILGRVGTDSGTGRLLETSAELGSVRLTGEHFEIDSDIYEE